MQTINVGYSSLGSDTSKLRLLLLKGVVSGSVLVGLFGAIIFLAVPVPGDSNKVESKPQKSDDTQRELTAPTQLSEQPIIIIKKSQKPVEIEEGSEAYHCIKNNGGNDCLNRSRFAPNYKIINPPVYQRNYDDYLVNYGGGDGDCGRYLNGQPNCGGVEF